MNRGKRNNKDTANKLVFILIIFDFLLTYYGINGVGCLVEANPFMLWLFNLPFELAFFIRVVMSLFIYTLIRVIQVHGQKYYKKVILFALISNLAIMVLHINWLWMEFVILKA